jgi:hypothetical protein
MQQRSANSTERPFLGLMTAASIAMSLLALAAADPKWLEFESVDAVGAGVAYDMTASAPADIAQPGTQLLAVVEK